MSMQNSYCDDYSLSRAAV